MRTIFYVNDADGFETVATVYRWLDNYIFYTSTNGGEDICKQNGAKVRKIKDIRILSWEMARWKPKVFVDTSFTPNIFPRNGEVTVFMPKMLSNPESAKILDYDYVFCPSESFKDALEASGARIEALRVVGYPKIEVMEENTALIRNLVYKPDGNAGLRAATLIYRIGITNYRPQLTLQSEPFLKK